MSRNGLSEGIVPPFPIHLRLLLTQLLRFNIILTIKCWHLTQGPLESFEMVLGDEISKAGSRKCSGKDLGSWDRETWS